MTVGRPIKSTKAESRRGWFLQRRIKVLVVRREKRYWVRKTREVPVEGFNQSRCRAGRWQNQGLNPGLPSSKGLTTGPLRVTLRGDIRVLVPLERAC